MAENPLLNYFNKNYNNNYFNNNSSNDCISSISLLHK